MNLELLLDAAEFLESQENAAKTGKILSGADSACIISSMDANNDASRLKCFHYLFF